MSENVLCFPANLLLEIGEVRDFSKDYRKYLFGILSSDKLCFISRDICETDPNFKQIIPYQVIKCDNRYFVYKRGKKGGENRLHAKLSIGIGGHINDEDIINLTEKERVDGYAIYKVGAWRELEEEVSFTQKCRYTYESLGVLYDDSNDVGKVHFGFVHLYTLKEADCIEVADEALDFVGWLSKQELLDRLDEFETWSQTVILNLLDD